MEKRKNPEKDLRSKSGLFFQIGLFIAMMLCVSAFEYSTEIMAIDPIELPGSADEKPFLLITEIKPPPPKPKIMRLVEVKNDEVPEDMKPEEFVPFDKIGEIELPPIELLPDEKLDEGDFIRVEEMPSPKGGYEAFYKFVQKNLNYPSQARRRDISGKVFVDFVVNERGDLVDIRILKGIGSGCDEEVLRIMNKAPKWNPGKQRGKPVRVKQVLPIEFRLN
jgi:protein TonB